MRLKLCNGSFPRISTGPLPTGQTTNIPTASGALSVDRPLILDLVQSPNQTVNLKQFLDVN